MSIRRNRITGDPILFAPARAARPGAFGEGGGARCPFCPGHESDTPPTIHAAGMPWRVRVFANKYPPVDGAEVIVESSRHGAQFHDLANARECLDVYRARLTVHADAACVSLFKNEGTAAGASIAHLHSQVVPLPFVPLRVAREIAGFESAASCPLCTATGDAIIEEDSLFRWVAAVDSSMPYQQRIVPKRHVPAFIDLSGEELDALAVLLQRCSRASLRVADAYNWLFMNFPETPSAHFYVDVTPRMTTIAGLELATGTFVEIIDPAHAAARLRD